MRKPTLREVDLYKIPQAVRDRPGSDFLDLQLHNFCSCWKIFGSIIFLVLSPHDIQF